MANWVEQNLHVVGRERDIDAFIRVGLRAARKRARWSGGDHELAFWKLCRLNRFDKRDTPESGVVLDFFRTRTQALFFFRTPYDYPSAFYKRLPRDWPALTFVCSINEDMGQFGGVILIIDGQVGAPLRK